MAFWLCTFGAQISKRFSKNNLGLIFVGFSIDYQFVKYKQDGTDMNSKLEINFVPRLFAHKNN